MNPITAITIALHAGVGTGLCVLAAVLPINSSAPLLVCACACYGRALYLGWKKA